MPILDTVVLFATGDSHDKHHDRAKTHLGRISEANVYLGAFALFEFDVVLKGRGFSFDERMERHALLLLHYPELERKIAKISPATLYLTSKLEAEVGLEYFDAAIAAEALQFDGEVVSTDKVFDRVEGLTKTW